MAGLSGLRQCDALPERFLQAEPFELYEMLGGPTLIHLRGQREDTLLVSVLQHGNETTGFYAVQRLLRGYAGHALPRNLSLFVANVAAARAGLRHLEGQPDYNRSWPGSELARTPEHALLAEVLEQMRTRHLFACVDVHNNTGYNPHYAAVNRLDPRFLHLATLFARTVVYFRRPRGVMTLAFAPFCPSVVLECGRVGTALGIEHAHSFLDACLRTLRLPRQMPPAHDLDLFHTVAQIRLRDGATVGVGDGDYDLLLDPDLDRLNFRELGTGTTLARARRRPEEVLLARSEAGDDVTRDYFFWERGEVRIARPVMPSMLTLDERVIHQDCLCYFMERVAAPRSGPPAAARRVD